jgi:hypothetical protein
LRLLVTDAFFLQAWSKVWFRETEADAQKHAQSQMK